MDGATLLSQSFEGKLERLNLLAMNVQTTDLFVHEYETMLETLRNDLGNASNIRDVELVMQRGNRLQAILKQHVTWAKQTYPTQYEAALKDHHQTREIQ